MFDYEILKIFFLFVDDEITRKLKVEIEKAESLNKELLLGVRTCRRDIQNIKGGPKSVETIGRTFRELIEKMSSNLSNIALEFQKQSTMSASDRQKDNRVGTPKPNDELADTKRLNQKVKEHLLAEPCTSSDSMREDESDDDDYNTRKKMRKFKRKRTKSNQFSEAMVNNDPNFGENMSAVLDEDDPILIKNEPIRSEGTETSRIAKQNRLDELDENMDNEDEFYGFNETEPSEFQASLFEIGLKTEQNQSMEIDADATAHSIDDNNLGDGCGSLSDDDIGPNLNFDDLADSNEANNAETTNENEISTSSVIKDQQRQRRSTSVDQDQSIEKVISRDKDNSVIDSTVVERDSESENEQRRNNIMNESDLRVPLTNKGSDSSEDGNENHESENDDDDDDDDLNEDKEIERLVIFFADINRLFLYTMHQSSIQ